jgi:(p)ppGpp synthase/HD superfamily hydrolase
MARIHRIMRSEPAESVELAYLMSKKFHKGQVRKELDDNGSPLRYFEHLRRTALILLDAGFTEPELIITALLHDSIEDSDEVALISKLIETHFGGTVADWVHILSKVPAGKDEYIDRLYEEMRSGSSTHFLIIKAADRLDNLRSLPDDPAFRKKQIAETKEKYIPLFNEFVAQSQSTTKMKRFKKILAEIRKICENG